MSRGAWKGARPGPNVNGINIKFTWLKDNLRPSKRKKKKLSEETITMQRHAFIFIFFRLETNHVKLIECKGTHLSPGAVQGIQAVRLGPPCLANL